MKKLCIVDNNCPDLWANVDGHEWGKRILSSRSLQLMAKMAPENSQGCHMFHYWKNNKIIFTILKINNKIIFLVLVFWYGGLRVALATPDLRKFPLFKFSSPAKSSYRSPNAIFLNIPTRTAALLLEAAMRIQKQLSASKSKTQNKNNRGFTVFGSILKRLSHRSRKREIKGHGVNVSVKDILRCDSSIGRIIDLLGDGVNVPFSNNGFDCRRWGYCFFPPPSFQTAVGGGPRLHHIRPPKENQPKSHEK